MPILCDSAASPEVAADQALFRDLMRLLAPQAATQAPPLSQHFGPPAAALEQPAAIIQAAAAALARGHQTAGRSDATGQPYHNIMTPEQSKSYPVFHGFQQGPAAFLQAPTMTTPAAFALTMPESSSFYSLPSPSPFQQQQQPWPRLAGAHPALYPQTDLYRNLPATQESLPVFGLYTCAPQHIEAPGQLAGPPNFFPSATSGHLPPPHRPDPSREQPPSSSHSAPSSDGLDILADAAELDAMSGSSPLQDGPKAARNPSPAEAVAFDDQQQPYWAGDKPKKAAKRAKTAAKKAILDDDPIRCNACGVVVPAFSVGRSYLRCRRVCRDCQKASSLPPGARRRPAAAAGRYCQLCKYVQPLEKFTRGQKSCTASLKRHRIRRRERKAEAAAAAAALVGLN